MSEILDHSEMSVTSNVAGVKLFGFYFQITFS